jgi:hypothetical protein
MRGSPAQRLGARVIYIYILYNMYYIHVGPLARSGLAFTTRRAAGAPDAQTHSQIPCFQWKLIPSFGPAGGSAPKRSISTGDEQIVSVNGHRSSDRLVGPIHSLRRCRPDREGGALGRDARGWGVGRAGEHGGEEERVDGGVGLETAEEAADLLLLARNLLRQQSRHLQAGRAGSRRLKVGSVGHKGAEIRWMLEGIRQWLVLAA